MTRSPNWLDSAKNIHCLSLDVDGVLTDGRLYYGEQGENCKAFHVRDGQALKTWHEQGHSSLIISGRSSPIVQRRASELGIGAVFMGITDKLAQAQLFCEEAGVAMAALAHMGDDFPDLALMSAAGLGISVADGQSDVRQSADFVTEAKGGEGAVGEAIYQILRLQGVTF